MGKWVKVASTSEINPGGGKVVEAEGQPIALFNVDGAFHAIFNTCAHRGGPLGEGKLEGAVVTCPWHGWKYDVKTGKHATQPTVAVRTFPTRVDGTDVLVEV